MVRFRLKDKNKYYELPTKANELDTKTFLRLQEVAQTEGSDEIDIACALCDAQREDFIKLSGKDLELLQEATLFIFEVVERFATEKRRTLKRITGEEIEVVLDFEKMEFGQRVSIDNIVKKYKDENPQLVIAIIAVLIAPTIYPVGDWTKELENIEEEIAITPAEATIPFFNFFLTNIFSLRNTIKAWFFSQKIAWQSKRKVKN